MRLYAPLYEGDSVLRPDAAIGASLRAIFKGPEPAPDFVRSNIEVEAADETARDIDAIVAAAHELRNAAVAELSRKAVASMAHSLKAAYTAITDWFERVQYTERDAFFAASENLAELEQRQRHFERTGLTHY